MGDSKLTALTPVTTLSSGDLVYMAIDPAGTPLSRGITEANFNKYFKTLAAYDKTLGSDHTYYGDLIQEAVGENVVFGQGGYYDLSEGEWKLADGNAIGTMPCEVIFLESKADGEACLMLTKGYIRDDAWNWTIDDTVKVLYVSATAGAFTETPLAVSGDFSQAIGTIRSADILFFNPSLAMAEVT